VGRHGRAHRRVFFGNTSVSAHLRSGAPIASCGRGATGGVDIPGRDSNPSPTTNDITVRNNLFVDSSAANRGGTRRFLLPQGRRHIVFDHNTVFTNGSSANWRVMPAVLIYD